MKVSLTFTPDGKGHGLYTEIIDLSQIGQLAIERASTIEYDNSTQCWRVSDTDGVVLFSNPSRQQCLDWERNYFDSQDEIKHETGRHRKPTKGVRA